MHFSKILFQWCFFFICCFFCYIINIRIYVKLSLYCTIYSVKFTEESVNFKEKVSLGPWYVSIDVFFTWIVHEMSVICMFLSSELFFNALRCSDYNTSFHQSVFELSMLWSVVSGWHWKRHVSFTLHISAFPKGGSLY